MSNYTVTSALWHGGFFVPADIVDRHLKLAPPDAIRALLYILRHGKTIVSPEELSRELSIDLPAAEDAIDYWIKDGLLQSAENVTVALPVKEERVPEKTESDSPAVVIKSGKMPSYSNAQIKNAVAEHPELMKMFSSAEEIYARPLNDGVINLLYGLFDWYGLSADAVITVLQRCAKSNRLKPASIKDEAESFYKNGAIDKDSANSYAQQLSERDACIDEISLLLRISDHSPYAKERKAFETWRFSYGFDADIISLALSVALKNTESDRYTAELLPYMQKVLSNWHRGGVKTAEDAKEIIELKSEGKGKASKKTVQKKSEDVSYDLNEEELLAMQRFSKGGKAE